MKKLRQRRIEEKKTVHDIAKVLKVSDMSVYHYELGKRKISIEKLKCLSNYFDCDINELID